MNKTYQRTKVDVSEDITKIFKKPLFRSEDISMQCRIDCLNDDNHYLRGKCDAYHQIIQELLAHGIK